MAGTLYVPRDRERVRYGLIGEHRPFPTVLSMYVRPFQDAWMRWNRRREPRELSLEPPRA
jgi:hypothetical protein